MGENVRRLSRARLMVEQRLLGAHVLQSDVDLSTRSSFGPTWIPHALLLLPHGALNAIRVEPHTEMPGSAGASSGNNFSTICESCGPLPSVNHIVGIERRIHSGL